MGRTSPHVRHFPLQAKVESKKCNGVGQAGVFSWGVWLMAVFPLSISCTHSSQMTENIGIVHLFVLNL